MKLKKEDLIITYFEKCIYKFPEITGISYQHLKNDGTEWDNPYDGLIFSNEDFKKPSKEELDAIDENLVREKEFERRELLRKNALYDKYKDDYSMLAALQIRNSIGQKTITLEEYINELEGD